MQQSRLSFPLKANLPVWMPCGKLPAFCEETAAPFRAQHRLVPPKPLLQAGQVRSSYSSLMVEEERAARSGTLATSLEEQITGQWVWERFRNLDLGMISNGVPRP